MARPPPARQFHREANPLVRGVGLVQTRFRLNKTPDHSSTP
jgi:hypothetical protein